MDAADMPLSEWFPVWYAELGRTWKIMLYLGLMGSFVWAFELIKGISMKKYRYEGFAGTGTQWKLRPQRVKVPYG